MNTVKIIIISLFALCAMVILYFLWKASRHSDNRPKNRNKVGLLAVLLIMAGLLASPYTHAMGTFTVSSSGSTFTIERTSNTSATERVLYRTISLSAIAGQHFTAAADTLTFDADHNKRTVTVAESTPAINTPYRYQTSSTRSYRFEVTDLGGNYLAHKVRNITTGISVSSNLFSEKTATITSGEITVTDKGYNQSGNPHTINRSSFYDDNNQSYISFLSAQLRMTLEFKSKEVSDGYQYLQVLANNTTGCDNANSADKGNPGTPSVSRYMAGFEMKTKGKDETYRTYTFPVLSVGSDAGASNPWGYGTTHPLSKQKFKDNCRATDGKIILPTNLTSISVRFDASGDDNDDWMVKELKAKITAVETTAPTKLGDPVVAPGKYGAGNTIYISVPFSEIVTISGTPYLHTDWGDYNYFSGSGSNVLTFSGTIPSYSLSNLITRNLVGTITDLAGNELTNKDCYKSFSGITIAYPWGGSGTEADPYVITTAAQLEYMATRVNANYGAYNFNGKYFVLANDIAYTITSDWDGYIGSISENNYTPIGCYGRSFQGYFDGQGHTISGIRVVKTSAGSNNDNESLGLFGFVSGGSVSNVVLRDCRFEGDKNIGGIVGYLSGGSVTGCTLYHVLAGTRDYVLSNSDLLNLCIGVVVGYGSATGNYYRDCRRAYTSSAGRHKDRHDNVYVVNTATGVTANYVSGANVTIDDTTYYASGSTFSLGFSGTKQNASVLSGFTATSGTVDGSTFTLGTRDVTINPTWASAWSGSGTLEAPYIISTTDQLDLLAKMVNGKGGYGYNTFDGTYFQLDNDIAYSDTTEWNDTESTENNFTAIGGWRSGTTYNQFKGTFDGGNHTISGIRIYKGGSGDAHSNQGLFGSIGTGGMVKNLTLADTRITGYLNVGGIAGTNYGIIQNCHVENDVLVADPVGGSKHGGVVGQNHGTVSVCTFSGVVSAHTESIWLYGGIVGYNEATISNCLVVGATIPQQSNRYGVITGENKNGTLTANYYRNCTVGETANATNVGVGYYGSASADRDGAKSVHTLTLGTDVSATGGETVIIGDDTYYAAGCTVTLSYTGTPAEGYRCTGFTATAGTVNGNTFTMPAADATVNARIEEVAYIISYNLDGGEITGDYPTGYSVTTPTFSLPTPTRTGYTFDGWTGTDLDAATMTVTISQGATDDRSYTAHWTAIDYTVFSLGWDGWNFEHGSVIPDKITGAHYGDVVTFAVHPESGCLLRELTVTNLTTSEAQNITADEMGHYSFTMPASDVEVYAEFAQGYTVIIDAGTEHGTITATPLFAYADQIVTLSITPDPGYELDWVEVNSSDIGKNTSFRMPNEDVTVTAVFHMSWASLNAAMQNGGSFTLPYDITAVNGDGPLTIPTDKTVTLDLNGHTLNRSLTSATANGSVIEVEGYGTLTLNDNSASGTGTITGGRNENEGGGVYVSNGTFTMNGGTISGNNANYGGGVYIAVGGVFTMTGGTITGNSAVTNAGGVFVRGSGSFNVSGSPVITDNTLGGNANNVNLSFSSSIITVTGALTNAARIGVTTQTAPTVDNPVVFTDGLSGNGTRENFIGDKYNVIITNGEAALTNNYIVTFLPGDGSGTMDPVPVQPNSWYTIPVCNFTVPDGMMFVGWLGSDSIIWEPNEYVHLQTNFTLTAVYMPYHTVTITVDEANDIEMEWEVHYTTDNVCYGHTKGSGVRFPDGAHLIFEGLPRFIASTPELYYDEYEMKFLHDYVTTDVTISPAEEFAIDTVAGDGSHERIGAYSRDNSADEYRITSAPAGATVHLIAGYYGGTGYENIKTCTVTGRTTGNIYAVTIADYDWSTLGCYFTMPDEPVEAFIHFANLCSVNIASNIEHGSVSIVGGEYDVFEGDDVTLTVTPDAGYALASLTVTYTDAYSETHNVPTIEGTGEDANKYTFTMPDWSVCVYATFVEASEVPTGINHPDTETKAVKFIKDAQIFIERNGRTYTITGQEIVR